MLYERENYSPKTTDRIDNIYLITFKIDRCYKKNHQSKNLLCICRRVLYISIHLPQHKNIWWLYFRCSPVMSFYQWKNAKFAIFISYFFCLNQILYMYKLYTVLFNTKHKSRLNLVATVSSFSRHICLFVNGNFFVNFSLPKPIVINGLHNA